MEFFGYWKIFRSTNTYISLTFEHLVSIRRETNSKQETLRVVTIVMICSTLASLWKFQYFQRPIYNQSNVYDGACIVKIVSRLVYSQKGSIVDPRLVSKYASAFWRPFKLYISLEHKAPGICLFFPSFNSWSLLNI